MLLTSQVKGLGPSGGAAARISRPLPVGVTVKHTKKREEVLKREPREQGAGEDKEGRRQRRSVGGEVQGEELHTAHFIAHMRVLCQLNCELIPRLSPDAED